MIKTILVILVLAILASASTVDAGECSEGYRAGRQQVKRMWSNRSSRCSNIDGFDIAVRRMIRNRYIRQISSQTSDTYNGCAKRGATDTLKKYQRECEDDETRESVICDEYWLEICCDRVCTQEETEYKSSDQVREANVCRTKCYDKFDGSQCNWHWRAEGCRRVGGDHLSNIHDRQFSSSVDEDDIRCIRPSRSRVREEGHDEVCEDLDPNTVPYECEFGDKLCCTESSRTTVTFEDKDHWGECTKKSESGGQKHGDDDDEGDDEGDDDDNDNGDEGRRIHCIRPRQSRVREEGHEEVCDDLTPNNVPFECEDDSKLCCTESSRTTVTFEDKAHWGECTPAASTKRARKRDMPGFERCCVCVRDNCPYREEFCTKRGIRREDCQA